MMLGSVRRHRAPCGSALLVLVCCSPTAACRSLREQQSLGPTLAITDSVELTEPDTVQIGRFAYLAISQAGGIFVADLAAGRVLRFSPDGILDGVIGSLGSGPGELLSAGQIGLIQSDSVLVVPDPRSRAISLFDARDGRFLTRYNTPFADVGQSWTQRGDTVTFGAQFSSGLIGRFIVAAGDVSLFGLFGDLPPAVGALGGTFFRYGRIETVPVGSDWLVLSPAEPGLRLITNRGELKARVDIPATRRRGVPPDLAQRHRTLGPGGHFRYLGSMAAGLWRLSSGTIVLIMMDVDANGPSEPTNPRYFVTLISPDLKTACIDGLLPFPSDSPLPTPYLVRDTLVALARRIDNDRLRTIVYRYAIDADACEWTALATTPG